MGFLDVFKSKSSAAATLPSGSFAVDRHGIILVSTISSRVPEQTLQEIATVLLNILADARDKGLPVTDLTFRFGAVTVRALDTRIGALIFLHPPAPASH